MRKRQFTEYQLQKMGILFPELYEPDFQAPSYCWEWLDEIDAYNKNLEKEIVERDKHNTAHKRTMLLIKVLSILTWSLVIASWFLPYPSH